MDDPNITIEEYIRLQEEKAQGRGKTFDWKTATYALSCEPTESPLDNNEIVFKISFDESDDEDYMVIFDENSFSCKIISVDNLKTDSEDENDEVNMPSSLSPEPTFGYIDDLDFFKDFENEFPAIAYNDLKSKSDPPIEPSLSVESREYNINKEVGQMGRNDEENLFFSILIRYGPMNTAYRSFSPNIRTYTTYSLFWIRRIDMAPLPHHDLRHPWLRYQVEGYDEVIVHSYEHRLEMIFRRKVNWALFTSNAWRRLFEIRGPLVREFMLEFFSTCRMSDTEMGLDVADTLCFQLGGARRRMTWRQFILALGLHTEEEMAEAVFGAYWSGSERVIPDKGDLRDYWIEISSDRDFLVAAPSYVHIKDPVRILCHRMTACSISGRGQGAEKVIGVDLFYLRTMDHGTANVLYLLAQYLFRHAEGRKSGARLSGGHFIVRLAAHFGLVSDEGLRDLSIIAREIPVIDLHELKRLNICSRFGDTWAWVAPGPERQQAAAAGAPGAAEDAPLVDEGTQAVPALVQAPQPPLPAPQHRTMTHRIDRLEEEMRELRQSVVGLQGVVESSITEQTRVSIWMISCMTQLMDASGRTYQAFDSTLVGSSWLSYQRRVRPKTGDASTSTDAHTDD
ncbi:hypothetical protein Tco_1182544 [Tanacetum coccineum]